MRSPRRIGSGLPVPQKTNPVFIVVFLIFLTNFIFLVTCCVLIQITLVFTKRTIAIATPDVCWKQNREKNENAP
jgi:hypothetical protein